jgi:hypothetical protein
MGMRKRNMPTNKLLITAIFLLCPVLARADITTGLIDYWSLNNKDTTWTSSTAGTTLDRGSNAQNGTMINMNTSGAPVAARVGQGFRFDGSTNYVNVSAGIVVTQPFSVSLWMYPTASSDTEILFSTNTGVNNGIRIRRDVSNQLALTLAGVADYVLSTATAAGMWHHLVVTANNTTAIGYVDGAKANTVAIGTISGTPNNCHIGSYTNTQFYHGTIDEVKVWNRMLSTADVQEEYMRGQGVVLKNCKIVNAKISQYN